MRRYASLIAVLALTAAACSTGTSTTAQIHAVQVDTGGEGDFNFFALTYFPNELTVHAGDTVRFENAFNGEPHTVTLGTLVQDLLDASDALTEEPEEPLPQEAALPLLLPDGPGDAPQAAANPCFLATGEPPATDPCTSEQQDQVPFDGTQSFYNSGWLAPDLDFSVELADDIAPGTYRYFCLLHRQGMQGSITVVPDGEEIPTAEEVAQEREDAIAEIQAALQPAFDQAAASGPDAVFAGTGSPELENAAINEFLPKEVSIEAGDTVSWNVIGPHTISFNAPTEAKLALTAAPDGSFHANEAAFVPSPPGPPPGEIQEATTIDGGSFDGEGFASSGIIISFPPELATYTLTFTTAGTYNYQCLIHEDMEGTVRVG